MNAHDLSRTSLGTAGTSAGPVLRSNRPHANPPAGVIEKMRAGSGPRTPGVVAHNGNLRWNMAAPSKRRRGELGGWVDELTGVEHGHGVRTTLGPLEQALSVFVALDL